jgi:uncharacterized protein
MYVDLNKLPKEGKKLHLEFNELFNDVNFHIKLFDGEVFKDKDEYVLHGKLEFEVEERCDRCLECYNLFIDDYIVLRLTCDIYGVNLADKPEIQLSDEDLDRLYIESSTIDINMLILEEAESLRPMKKLCISDCKGLCEHCGINLNKFNCDCCVIDESNVSIGDLINKYAKK